ncbi:MAG: class I SAM-dependent methyltransferase [Candidatus Omnitrophica bacterium]|jgi:SAM-dependent methyltransferase|nr:class I SAM-dependent methyltransferase [Candidatus Omnitrophota bacterium]MDD5513065.1 class I SAM-dependent methyltransferase [Candidatus Omnitrophota bacterium]
MNKNRIIRLQDNWSLDNSPVEFVSSLTVKIRWERLKRIFARLIMDNCRSGCRILDIGSGDGDIFTRIAAIEPRYMAIEPSLAMIERFKAKSGNFICRAFGERIPFKDRVFDAVILSSVLDHGYEPRLILQEAERILVPGGKMFFLLANDGAWYKRLFKEHNRMRKTASVDHNFFFSGKDLQNLLRENKLKLIIIKHFDFLRLPLGLEEFLMKVFPSRILDSGVSLSDKLLVSIFPGAGGSFICAAAKLDNDRRQPA